MCILLILFVQESASIIMKQNLKYKKHYFQEKILVASAGSKKLSNSA